MKAESQIAVKPFFSILHFKNDILYILETLNEKKRFRRHFGFCRHLEILFCLLKSQTNWINFCYTWQWTTERNSYDFWSVENI
jgi:hypothetical protein